MNKTDYYFTLELTENEHSIVENMIRQECTKRGYEVLYYRKFKNGHVPCQRECKINTLPWKVEQMLKDLDIVPENYHHESCMAI